MNYFESFYFEEDSNSSNATACCSPPRTPGLPQKFVTAKLLNENARISFNQCEEETISTQAPLRFKKISKQSKSKTSNIASLKNKEQIKQSRIVLLQQQQQDRLFMRLCNSRAFLIDDDVSSPTSESTIFTSNFESFDKSTLSDRDDFSLNFSSMLSDATITPTQSHTFLEEEDLANCSLVGSNDNQSNSKRNLECL